MPQIDRQSQQLVRALHAFGHQHPGNPQIDLGKHADIDFRFQGLHRRGGRGVVRALGVAHHARDGFGIDTLQQGLEPFDGVPGERRGQFRPGQRFDGQKGLGALGQLR